ncbi:uncharacterized protein [Porites lutea]|uniref:uncharacterized protein n=1 Tax=Porites lutea TaxID=51062 RepID=UPI003CC60C63
MEVPYVFSALFVLTMSAAAVHVQSSLSHDGISLVRRKRVAKANSTCTTQKLLQRYSPIGAILKSQEGKNKNFFNVREEAVFVCKNDYRKIGQLPSFICQEDSTWKEYSTNQTGFCVVKRCNVEKFSCKTVNTEIDACKRCNCIYDCADSSDEASCGNVSCAPLASRRVDSFDPNGLSLSLDSTYSPTIKIPTTKKPRATPKSTTPTVAIVLFALILFAAASFVACKVGKRIIGPTCSFGYCLALVSRRRFSPESPSNSAEIPPERRPLQENTNRSNSREGARSMLQARYLEDESDESFRGSSDNII